MDSLTVVPLSMFAGDACALDVTRFRDRYGDAFLIKSGVDKVRQGQLQTVAVVAAGVGHFVLGRSVVFCFAGVAAPVTVGRAKTNHVVLADASVSTFHAGLLRAGDGWAVHDAESRNGTSFDGVVVPVRGAGPAVPLVPGKVLRVGDVELLFADAALVAKLASLEEGA
jgi:pSer/pThr/pTyr-binding forkhead associated (FHA) protein